MTVAYTKHTNQPRIVCDRCNLPGRVVTLHRKGKKMICSMCIMRAQAQRCQAKLQEIQRKISAEEMKRKMSAMAMRRDGQSLASGG